MERLRRVLERNCAIAESRNQAPPVPFDRARPRDLVWSAAVDDHSFWHKQFEDPALIIQTKTGKLGDVITGEAPVEQQFRGEPRTVPEPKRRRIDKPHVDQAKKVHREINGSYTHNRRGVALCAEFQSGKCQRGPTIFCPRNENLVHQRKKCHGESHGGNSCNMTPKEPSVICCAGNASASDCGGSNSTCDGRSAGRLARGHFGKLGL